LSVTSCKLAFTTDLMVAHTVGEDFHSWIPRIFHNLPAAHPRPASHFPQGHKSRASAAAADKPGDREKDLKGSAPERVRAYLPKRPRSVVCVCVADSVMCQLTLTM
jgi:hypothetical protein